MKDLHFLCFHCAPVRAKAVPVNVVADQKCVVCRATVAGWLGALYRPEELALHGESAPFVPCQVVE